MSRRIMQFECRRDWDSNFVFVLTTRLTSEGKMAPSLSDSIRRRIVELNSQELGVTDITLKLKEEGITVARSSVYCIIKKWNVHKTIARLPPKNPRPMVDVTDEVLDFIDEQMEKNDELTANRLRSLINEKFNITFSTSKVRRIRKKLGWMATGTKYCQLIRQVNQGKRFRFAKMCLEANENFDNVLWSDESTVQLDWNGKISFQRWWEPPELKGKPKHPFKLHVWACISKRGTSPILIFEGIMERSFYIEEIIKGVLSPFIHNVFPDGHRFMQDNDPKHTSNDAARAMIDENIVWWKTLSESPDMNPIENFWHELKERLRNDIKPRTKEELIDGIRSIWSTITPEKCHRYISHLNKVLPKVVEWNGKASGY